MKKHLLKISIAIATLAFLIMPFPVLASWSISVSGASNITHNSATFTSSFSRNNDNLKYTFWEYNNFDFKNRDSGINVDPADRRPGTHYTTLSGLSPETTYYYGFCFVNVSTNCAGNVSFTTLKAPPPPPPPPPGPPAVNTTDASFIGSTFAGLNGHMTPDYINLATDTWFEYDLYDPTKTSLLKTTPIIESSGEQLNMYAYPTDLDPDTNYSFRACALNTLGTNCGSILSFTTLSDGSSPPDPPPPPGGTISVFTYPTGALTETSAVLYGSGSPDPTAKTTAYFRYATMDPPPVFCNDIYGTRIISTEDIPLPDRASFSQEIFGLIPNTTYYYCAVISNKNRIIYEGNTDKIRSFTTRCVGADCASVTTKSASSITKNSVILNGFYNTKPAVDTFFEYSKSLDTLESGAGSVSGTKNQIAGSYGEMFANVSSLTPNTFYYYRAVAKKLNGTAVYGEAKYFKTKMGSIVNPCPEGTPTGGTAEAVPPGNLSALRISQASPAPPEGSDAGGGWGFQIGSSISVPYVGPSVPRPISDYIPINTYSSPPRPIGPGGPRSISGFIPISIPTFGDPCPPENPPPRPKGPELPTPIPFPTPSSDESETFPTTSYGISVDAIVRFQEGVEHVFVRQIMGISEIARAYGYQSNMDLQQFANDLAHRLAQIFGYYEKGKEIRVLPPDIAAYELKIGSDGLLMVNEYYAGILISSRKINEIFKKPPAGYEYNFKNF